MILECKFPPKHFNNRTNVIITTDSHKPNFQIRQVRADGTINTILFDLEEVNELREWLNKNLPR